MEFDPTKETIVFAERLLNLLDQVRTVSTYKYALLLALLDVVLEQTDRHGRPPQSVTTRQLAEKTIALYWHQTNFFSGAGDTGILSQALTGKAVITQDVLRFRSQTKVGEAAPLYASKLADPTGYQWLLKSVEWNLIKNPLPRLQMIGGKNIEFIYSISWGIDIENHKKMVSDYQNEKPSVFDNRVLLMPGVGEHLLLLNTLLRPLIQREWTRFVARENDQPEATLENFLFQTPRNQVATLCRPLLELQDGYCFYCHERIKERPEVDHFIPWSRQPNDGLANLVVAHGKCNRMKSYFLAATDHLEHWLQRVDGTLGPLDSLRTIAADSRWDLALESSMGVASSIYLRLKPEMVLWIVADQFESVEESTLNRLSDSFSRFRVA